MLTPDEAQVAEILTQLPRIIFESEARASLRPFTWASKRKRSAIDVSPSPSRLRLRLRVPSLKTPSPLHRGGGGGGGSGPLSDNDCLPVIKAEASSPATPLSFSPSESDEKRVVLKKKIPLKKNKVEYLKKIEELTKGKGLLLREIENVKRYFDDLKAYNLKLKARKEELSVGHKRENPCMQITFQVVDANASVKSSSMAEIQDPAQFHHHVPLIASQISESSKPMTSFPSTSESNLVNNTNMGPLGIPDLNVSLDESMPPDSSQPFDLSMANKHLSRVMAAQARQKRIQINRVKNSIGINKARHSNR